MQVSQLRILGRESLVGVAEPSREAAETDFLLSYVTNLSRADIIAHPDRMLDPQTTKQFIELLERRKRHEPIAYITGTREFFGYPFLVTPDVLVPRPETELLVELMLERIIPLVEGYEEFSIIDVGTGSGCILLSIAKSLTERFGDTVFSFGQFAGVDRSQEALLIAAKNASSLELTPNILFGPSDLLSIFRGKVDKLKRPLYVVANLPYVPDEEKLPRDVEEYEPHIALRGGPDGLSIVRRLIDEWAELAVPGETLMLEVGEGQPAKLREELHERFAIEIESDLAGIERVLILRSIV